MTVAMTSRNAPAAPTMIRRPSSLTTLTLLLPFAALAACSAPAQPFQQESFPVAASPYAHRFEATSSETCEGAQRALLSQGYLTTWTRADIVDGTKNFQPSSDSHVTVHFHVVCAPNDSADNSSTVYVNAVRDGYALKKNNMSASVGLSVFGSVSLPIGSSADSMVEITSETIPAGAFYERFFQQVDQYVRTKSFTRTSAVAPSAVVSRSLPALPDESRIQAAQIAAPPAAEAAVIAAPPAAQAAVIATSPAAPAAVIAASPAAPAAVIAAPPAAQAAVIAASPAAPAAVSPLGPGSEPPPAVQP